MTTNHEVIEAVKEASTALESVRHILGVVEHDYQFWPTDSREGAIIVFEQLEDNELYVELERINEHLRIALNALDQLTAPPSAVHPDQLSLFGE